ncbi:YvrJ protein family [Romboutsia lituseburensis]|uniref:YvrJ protein family protein n=1 Tax=Romboutsia lituseburensis DSM 797 TaxID=1121325 RepID=A0A1G9TAV8_9FIRM|nr:YvrJ protein family [Romboutsia lituseburensis]SDM44899.1 YvrJ protein family protein [Romboutsia lituseburensis DSM 797]
MKSLENLYQNIANLGFPIVIAFYLLIRIEGKLDTLTNSINELSLNIEKLINKPLA